MERDGSVIATAREPRCDDTREPQTLARAAITSPGSVALRPPVRLQRAAGNQAVQSLLRDIDVSHPGDADEVAADRIAARALAGVSHKPASGRCACGGTLGADGECARCRDQRLRLQRRATLQQSGGASPAFVTRAVSEGGGALDSATRESMEAAFGRDFADVRVHTGPTAAAAAKAVAAEAFTFGTDVVFGRSRYQPQSERGRALIAHELAHVIQQTSGKTGGPVVQRQPLPQSAGGGGESTLITARPLTDEEVFALTGARPNEIPENVLIPVGGPEASVGAGGGPQPATPLLGKPAQEDPTRWPAYVGGAFLQTPMPAYPIAPGSTGIFVHPAHVSIFAQQPVNPLTSAFGFDVAGLTTRGFRAELWRHMLGQRHGSSASASLYGGTPGSFAQDIIFPMQPLEPVTAVSRLVGAEQSASFAETLRSTQYAELYRFSPPPPGSADYIRVYGVRDGAQVSMFRRRRSSKLSESSPSWCAKGRSSTS